MPPPSAQRSLRGPPQQRVPPVPELVPVPVPVLVLVLVLVSLPMALALVSVLV